MATAAIVLAAGRGTRYHGPEPAHKLLSLLDGEPLIRHAVKAALAAPVDAVVVVTGDRSLRVGEALADLGVRLVENPDHADGMATSLRRGIGAVHGHTDAALVVLGDQPGVPAAAYRAVLDTWRREASPIVVPSYEGVRGHPVLFAAALFDELLSITGDAGARSVIAADPERVQVVALPFPPPADVDTADDLEALRGGWPGSRRGDV